MCNIVMVVGNILYLKVAKSRFQMFLSQKKCEMMQVLAVVVILEYMCFKQYIVFLKVIHCYMSIIS